MRKVFLSISSLEMMYYCSTSGGRQTKRLLRKKSNVMINRELRNKKRHLKLPKGYIAVT